VSHYDPRAALHRDMAVIMDELSLNILSEVTVRQDDPGWTPDTPYGMVWIGSLSGFEIAPKGSHTELWHRCDWHTDMRPDALHDGSTYLGNVIVSALEHRAAGCGIPHTNLCPICGHYHKRCMSTTCSCGQVDV